MKTITLATGLFLLAQPTIAASLNALNGMPDLAAPAPLDQNEPETIFLPTNAEPVGKFQFVDGDIFEGNPLGDLVNEDQWANPKAATADNLLRRR